MMPMTPPATSEEAGTCDRLLLEMVQAMAKLVAARDPYTVAHEGKVAALSDAIAQKLGWSAQRRLGLKIGAFLHDIGKIEVPTALLNRPGPLTDDERVAIKTHSTTGAEIVAEVNFPWPVHDMILQHHERLDGTGYPSGLKGEQIIPEARVIAVADVYDAMASRRPYRDGLGRAAALAHLRDGAGTAYDPTIVAALEEVLAERDAVGYVPAARRLT